MQKVYVLTSFEIDTGEHLETQVFSDLRSLGAWFAGFVEGYGIDPEELESQMDDQLPFLSGPEASISLVLGDFEFVVDLVPLQGARG
jgi:hypothetical protein